MQGGEQPGLGMDSVQDAVPQDRGGCCPALRRLVPVGFGAEVWTLFALSGPLFLFQVLTFMIHVVSSVFCGHLGKLELASVTLSVAFVNVCGVSIGLGLSSACDTLMSQSFGSPNKKHVGVILQRGTLVLLLCCFPCWALFLNTQQILLLFRQDPAVSRLTQEYVLIFIPALPGIVWPQVFSGIVGNCINGLANYILVSMLSLGVRGSAYASTMSYFVQTIFLFLYIVLKKLHLETWAGWSSQCLQDWGPFFSLAVPSMLMICIEWWAYEIGSFLMGLISVLDLSGQAILYELATIVYMIPLGLSNAVCVRVGMALGAADTAQAKRSAISGMLCTVGTSLVVGMLLSLLKNKLGHIFTNDEEVIALVNKVLPIYIVFQLFEAVCCVYGGVLRGTGKQAFGAIVNAITYYVVGLPLGIVLTFVVRMRIMGSEARRVAATEPRRHGERGDRGDLGPPPRACESCHLFSGHGYLPRHHPDDVFKARVPPGPLQDPGSSPCPVGPGQPPVNKTAAHPPRGCSGGGVSHADGGPGHQVPDRQTLATQLGTRKGAKSGRPHPPTPAYSSTRGSQAGGTPWCTPPRTTCRRRLV
uniref:multidrug and toxin extrusion protein 2-like isoform X2 n=1 Tax=Halichoerus grypus TaxID=9711 RepID=UPI001658DF2E|nr:multidrug and toxin extrusion protein 2-like isoform X2 [Halichoerus grypus]